jgi:protein-S-isoprenylcysteine O-methyltransferase Ste14
MKTKIKKAIVSASTVALALPALAMAQYAPPEGTNLPHATVMEIITSIMNWLLMVIGIVGVIGFAIAGILYLTSAGDESRIETAKKAMLYSIVGVIVALAGVVALRFAQNLLGGSNAF